MIAEGSLSFREFVMREPLPLATIQAAVLEFLRHRTDAVLFGAQAVNAYVAQPRMTQDVDIVSTRAVELAEELRAYLGDRFHIAVRVREVREGVGYRIYQVRREGNRHLVNVRPVQAPPRFQQIDDVAVVAPDELVAGKVLAHLARAGRPKSFTDRRDLAVLLLTFPELKADHGPVRERLMAAGAGSEVLNAWSELAREEILPELDDEGY